MDIKHPVPYILSNHKNPTPELVKHLKNEKFLLQMLSVLQGWSRSSSDTYSLSFHSQLK